MANWNKDITLEVTLPYITQGCTLGHLDAKIRILSEDIWFDGHDKDSLCWKAYVRYGDYPILVMGKATTKKGRDFNTSTYKISAWNTCDGMTKGKEQYRTKVLSYT